MTRKGIQQFMLGSVMNNEPQALSVDVGAVVLESHKNWIDKSPVKSLQISAEYLKGKVK